MPINKNTMNYFIIYPFSATPLPLIAMVVLIFVAMLLFSNYKKRKLADALNWKIKVSDEVISVQGFRGRVLKIEGETVSICMADDVVEVCTLAECVPLEILIRHSKLLKLGEYIEDYRVAMARRIYNFSLHTPAAKTLKWLRNTRLSLKGIEIMLAFAFADLLLNLADVTSFFESGGVSYFKYDVVQDLILPICVVIGILVGGILHLAGLYGMEDLSQEEDAKAMTLIHRGFYIFFIAEIIDFFPLPDWISFVLYIIGFVILIVGYHRLKNSVWQNELSRSGFFKALIASIFLLIGYIIPDVGFILSFVGYVIYYLAWEHYICKSMFKNPDWWE